MAVLVPVGSMQAQQCIHATLAFALTTIQDKSSGSSATTVPLADMMRYAGDHLYYNFFFLNLFIFIFNLYTLSWLTQVMTDHAGPGFHLALPVPQGGEGGHNQEGPGNVAQLALELQRTDGLCSLAQPHLHGMHQISMRCNRMLAFLVTYDVDVWIGC